MGSEEGPNLSMSKPLFLSLSLLLLWPGAGAEKDLVMMISFDGFRNDYFSLAKTPNFDALRKDGVYVPRMKPIFPTKTFPNHHAISTGLFAETHGIIANSILDPKTREEVYMFTDGEDIATADHRIAPIWVTNEEAGEGRYSGVSMWAGVDFHWGPNGSRPTHFKSYNKSMPWEERVDLALSWFSHPKKPANLIMFYIEEPDSAGHGYGPDSPQVKAKVEEVDKLVGYLISQLKFLDLWKRTNLILLSDHGMMGVKNNAIVKLDSIPPSPNTYNYTSSSPTLLIYPLPGKEEEVYQGFLNASKTQPFSVYETANSPPDWHYGPTPYMPPFYIVADLGYAFSDISEPEDTEDEGVEEYGVHGYNNSFPEMQPYFIAHGPAFKKGYESSKDAIFNNVDVYALICHLLGIQPQPNNGTLEHSMQFLSLTGLPSTGSSDLQSGSTHFQSGSVALVLGIMAGIIVVPSLTYLVVVYLRQWKRQPFIPLLSSSISSLSPSVPLDSSGYSFRYSGLKV